VPEPDVVPVGDSHREVGENDGVLEREAVRLGVCVIVLVAVLLDVMVEDGVTVLMRLMVRVPEAVTDGVPVICAV